jgi:hypothetical protein
MEFKKAKEENKNFVSQEDFLEYIKRMVKEHGLGKNLVIIENPTDFRKLKDPILIYQMGKVGSSSVLASLKNANGLNTIFHIHQLSDTGIEKKAEWLSNHGVKDVPEMEADLMFIKKLRTLIDSHRYDFQWKIITLTRDPISLEISSFFENIWMYADQVFDPLYKPVKEKILDYFGKYFINETNDPCFFNVSRNYFLNWFDEELNAVFGLDVYSAPYNFSTGYTIYRKDNVSVLLIRLEDLDKSFTKAVKKFFNLEGIVLVKENITSKKEYYELYRQVTDEISIPLEVCEKIYSTRYARHFYTPSEISGFIKKWNKK